MTHRACVVLDFDGTICTGDAPVWAYADRAFASMPEDAAADARSRLTAFLDGRLAGARFGDGYAAVASFAAAWASPAVLREAYEDSRRSLERGEIEIAPPEGLHDFLGELGEFADRVLVTNASTGVPTFLRRLGVDDVIDATYLGADKPAGFRVLLPRLCEGRAPADLLSVGDFYDNDLAPMRRAGCATAFIDRFGTHAGPSDFSAPDFPQLYGPVMAWARGRDDAADGGIPGPRTAQPMGAGRPHPE